MLLKFYGFLWYFSSICLTLIYKYIGYLKLNMFVTTISFFLQSFVISLYIKKLPEKPSKESLKVITVLSSFILLCNFSLEIISVHLLVISKSITPLLTIFYSEKKLKSLLPFIIIGIGLYLSNTKVETKDTIISYTLMFFVTIITSIKFPILKHYFFIFPEDSTIDLLNKILIYMGIISFPFGIFQLYNKPEIQDPEIILFSIFLTTIFSLFISIGEYTIVHFKSLIDTVFIDIFKQTILIIISGIKNQLQITNWLGIVLILTIILDFKLKETPIQLP